ncbi:GlcNAc-transferase family protein, partial [Staphylococcus aureus]
MLIFVQIAAYRDPQIKATIKDLLSKAKYPDKLRFGICNQIDLIKDQSEKLDEYSKDFRFRIFQVNYTESKGVCWARSITQSLYRNEEFTLQIDS